LVLLNTASKSMVPKLIFLFGDLDLQRRWEILNSLFSISADAPPDPDLVPLFLLACGDPHAEVRESALRCLDELGSSATNALPAIQKLCADTNLPVRVLAARALWDISHQTNAAVPVLYGILSQTTDTTQRFWIAYYLAGMNTASSVVIETLASSLTNKSGFIATSACESLGRLGPAATPAITALRTARDSAGPLLSAYATRALAQIEPKKVVR
jgi:HEAT repeat protein